MIYPVDFEQKIGFDQVRQKLMDKCSSGASIALVEEISFKTDFNYLSTSLRQCLEFKQILERNEAFPSQYFFDPSSWLQKISLVGSYLEERELLDLANSLSTILACRIFFQKSRDIYPELFKLTEPVTLSAHIGQNIRLKIDDTAIVKDSASTELGRLRRRLRTEQGRIRKLSEQIFRKAVEEKWVPEGALPTIREGRLVIPVLAEHKRHLRGFVLDESATGQTVFMEPAEMLDANNEIRELECAEKREVIRVLREITDELRSDIVVLNSAFEFLTLVDFVRAKAKFSLEINAEMPVIHPHPELALQRATHPLLYLSLKGRREIVPLEIDLSDEDRMLLVSGPNAGGKSVCLKTVALLQYMIQCGLLVPASDRSRMGLFEDIFLDIGDQQSIENDLSTYSSHLQNMKAFIQFAGGKSLVLMDELGSGTDPNFGGAIAQSVLDALLNNSVWGIATTHYYNLKLFAGQHKGIRNAAMRFDDKNLVPLYILDIGKPGSSFALEIARKTGLPEHTLAQAERLVGKELSGFDTLVRDLEKERQALSEKVIELDQRDHELKLLYEKYKMLDAELQSRKKNIIEKAKEEAQNLLRETNREIEKTIRHIKENRAEKKETLKVRRNLQDLSEKVKNEIREAPAKPTPLQEGDRVRILGQEGVGIIQVIKGKNAVVQFGDLKSVVNLAKLEKSQDQRMQNLSVKSGSSGLNVNEKRATFNSNLDIRGKRVEEVAPLLDQFMDTALLLGIGELKILHGKGEGVLRKVVREHLKKHREVASLSDEHVDRGGDGITVVVLK
ncbi:MAG TPA: Smr/MutS family protein [Cyclobacteriaceae bacterium]|nr:Smr/MutS family protein [Cyclobacteriaceae bacterium]